MFGFTQNIKIPMKLLIAFALLIVVTIIMAAMTMFQLLRIGAAEERLDAVWQANTSFTQYERAFNQRREAVLFYLITGDRSAVSHVTKARESMTALTGTLNGMKDDAYLPAGLQQAVGEAIRLSQDYDTAFVTPQLQLMRHHQTVTEARVIEVTKEPEKVVAEFNLAQAKVQGILADEISDAAAAVTGAIEQTKLNLILGVSILFVSALGLAFMLTRLIARPITGMTDTMSELADGNLDVSITGSERRDEIGSMAAAVLVFQENARERVKLHALEEEKQRVEAERQRQLSELTKKFSGEAEELSGSVQSALQIVLSSVGTLLSNAAQTGQQAQDVSAGAVEASANIQTVASASTELTASISEISNQISRAASVSRQAVEDAESTNTRVTSLSSAAEQVGQVVTLIQDIAEQTNLLALNATIEAARAGEAGKGFAVVASEVKNLANQTARATDEIKSKIDEIQNETSVTAESIRGFRETIRQIDELATAVSAAIEEQGAATAEIARNVEQAAASTSEISTLMGSVASSANETDVVAHNQENAVSDLGRQNDQLQNSIKNFISAVENI
tara:strand:+ start:1654 stop:3351 length:1698 start_codon:yes stop_codon:yes gene_type:complete